MVTMKPGTLSDPVIGSQKPALTVLNEKPTEYPKHTVPVLTGPTR